MERPGLRWPWSGRGPARAPAIAVDLLRAGVAVHLQEPPAATLADADRVLATSAETGTRTS